MAVEEGLTAALLQAELTSTPLPLPDPGVSITDGYAIQEAGRRLRCSSGARHVGYKVGLTSTAAQAHRAIDHPVYGYLLEHRIVEVRPRVTMAGLIKPRIEVELAFALGRALEGNVHREDVLSATSQVMLAIEVVDSRWQQPADFAGTLIADNVSGAGVVLGGCLPIGSLDLTSVEVAVTVGDKHLHGDTSNVLGDPAASVAWLAAELAQRGGGIRSGDIVLSGSLCPPTPIQREEPIIADFGVLGSVSTQLAW